MGNREIDKLIAEKVMRWRVIPPSVHEGTGFRNQGYFVVQEETEDEDAVWISQSEFFPSTDIQDAWLIVEKLKQEDQYYFKLENGDLKDYECHFSNYSAEGDTAPMAICLASLRVVGFEIGL